MRVENSEHTSNISATNSVWAIRFSAGNKEFSVETTLGSNNGDSEIVSSLYERGRLVYTCVMPNESESQDSRIEEKLAETGVELRAQVEDIYALWEEVGESPDSDVALVLAQLFESRGLHSEAVALYETICAELETDDSVVFRYGQCLTELGDYNRAAELLTVAVRLKPMYADYRNALGVALAWCGKITDSLKQFENALELNTYYADAHYCIGMTFLFNGIKGIEPNLTQDFVARSLRSLEKSVVIDSSIQTADFLRGMEHVQNGEIREAFGMFRRNRENLLRARRRTYEEFRADLLSRTRSTDRHVIVNRIRFLVKELNENPGYVDLSYELATNYLRLAVCEWQTGLRQFERTLERNPKLRKAVRAHDIAYTAMSDLKQMIEDIDKDRLSGEDKN